MLQYHLAIFVGMRFGPIFLRHTLAFLHCLSQHLLPLHRLISINRLVLLNNAFPEDDILLRLQDLLVLLPDLELVGATLFLDILEVALVVLLVFLEDVAQEVKSRCSLVVLVLAELRREGADV